MATSPERVRAALLRVTKAAQAELRAVAAAASREPAEWRAAIFAAAPLIVSEYAPAASTLGLDWFDDIRTDAAPGQIYTPTPRLLVTDDDVAQMVAATTEMLHNVEIEIADEVEKLIAEAEAAAEAALQHQVAAGFRDTVMGNATDDPAALGWQRFTRTGGCKFCLMLAGRGAVYTEASVRFAAHTDCNCLAGPSYDPDAPQADVLQYVASRRTRSDADRARVREYLNEHFPDAHG